MGFEIVYKFHPRLEGGNGYDHEVIKDKKAKVGKPFDDTSLEKCAAAITAQLARRDIWVTDVEVYELVKKKINFKESKDGKGIILSNKKFVLNSTAELIAEDLVEVPMQSPVPVNNGLHPHEMVNNNGLHPHEMVNNNGLYPHEMVNNNGLQVNNTDDLYANPNQISVKETFDPRKIDNKKIIYQVYYEPYMYQAEAKILKLRFTEDTKYNVHKIIPSVTGKLNAQKIALTDDTGQVVVLDEKFFTFVGRGLVGDDEVGFSEPRANKRKRLMYDDELTTNQQTKLAQHNSAIPGTPIDNEELPSELLAIPDLRPNKSVM